MKGAPSRGNAASVADYFTESASPGGQQPLGVDIAGTKPQNSIIRFAVVGTAPGVANDQASFFFQLPDTLIDATHAFATVTPAVAAFNNAQVSEFVAFSPMYARNVNLTGADSAGTISSMQLQPLRRTPMGLDQSEVQYANSYQTAKDFQLTRVQIPTALHLDGYTGIRITNTANATPASYTATFTLAAAPDRRLGTPAPGPAVVRSSAD